MSNNSGKPPGRAPHGPAGGALGTYTVTVTATDTKGVSGTATFVWTVAQ